MSRTGNYAGLAASLATVAIASLGGPLLAGRVALGEVVKYAQAGYETGGPARDLHREVTAGIRRWSEGEAFEPIQVEHGLALATKVVADYGANGDAIAQRNYDPSTVSAHVLKAAQDDDPYWGKEPHYDVAERAVEATYRALVKQWQAAEPVLLPAIKALTAAAAAQAARAEARYRRLEVGLDDLASALIAASTTAEVMGYLRVRLADWDMSVWHPDQQWPSALERQLLVRSVGRDSGTGASSREGDMISAAEALDDQRMLVVLGGPGSGKTWQARRFARSTAQAALAALEDGADLSEVELPLLTTWDEWTRTPGSTREALVASSFASGLGHSDPGEGGDATDRLRRTFRQAGRRVLLIVDSLDEAADLAAQGNRWHELTALHGWRVVVTSRPAAWAATDRGRMSIKGGPRVVEVQNLRYPTDVEAFIREWFATEVERGEALIEQMRARPELARVAVIPLMLTFYCLITETTELPGQPLPKYRGELYQRLLGRLLSREWVINAPGYGAAPDVTDCKTLLASWAWSAVRDRLTPTGLGNWADTFTQPSRPQPPEGAKQAIDAVAPVTGRDGEGGITRRFVHRTVLEHCVAEHIATLNPDMAAKVLLPHLWFDADWEVAAPAAIAAHNKRKPGVLLERLLERAVYPIGDSARQVAATEFDRVLLAIAEESDPLDWTPAHQGVFHACRVRSVLRVPDAVTRTMHWTESNPQARAAVLAALPAADSRTVRILAVALSALSITAGEREEARAALIIKLSGAAGPWTVETLVVALTALSITAGEREEARAAVLTKLSGADSRTVRGLVVALSGLEPTAGEREQARAAVLAALPAADSGTVRILAVALSALSITAGEREQARAALIIKLSGAASPWTVETFAVTLSALSITAGEREEARAALIIKLSGAASPWTVRGLVVALSGLEPTAGEREEARAALIIKLSGAASPWTVRGLVVALTALSITAGEREEARAAVLTKLSGADSRTVRGLVVALSGLEPTAGEREEARAAVLAALPAADSGTVEILVAELSGLELTAGEREQARAAVLTKLSGADSRIVGSLVVALSGLEPTAGEREEARAAVLIKLSGAASPWTVGSLVVALSGLEPTAGEREQARAAVLIKLSGADSRIVGSLVVALSGLEPTAGEREQARAALITVLPGALSSDRKSLVAALTALSITAADREHARTVLITALPGAAPRDLEDLVATLTALKPTAGQWEQARAAVLQGLQVAHHSNDKRTAVALRLLSPLDSWIDWLKS